MMQKCSSIFMRSARSFTNNIVTNLKYKYLTQQNIRHISTINSRCIQSRYLSGLPVQHSVRRSNVANFEDLLKYINEEKVFYLKLLTNIFNTIEFDKISSEQAILLLQCCGESVPDSSREKRNQVCQDIYQKLKNIERVDLNIYNTYLQICNENDFSINTKEFLRNIKCDPDKKTLKLLLTNSCKTGHIEQAYDLLEVMKNKRMSLDEDVFNQLVLAHAINGGLKSAEEVIHTMKIIDVPVSLSTIFSILKGIIIRNDLETLRKVLEKYPIKLNAEQTLNLVEILGLGGHHEWLSKLQNVFEDVEVSRDFVNRLEKICTHLVHMDKPDSSIAIYEHFVKPSLKESYGFFLLKEMLHCDIDIKKIISIAKHLSESKLNEYALETITGVALKHKYIPQVWELFENISILRPHYFWPLFVDNGTKHGESGVFSIMEKMNELNIKADSETLEQYVFQYCDLTNSKLLIRNLQELGYSVKEILNSLVVVFLQQKKTRKALQICKFYEEILLLNDKIMKMLPKAWRATNDVQSVVYLLQRFCESSKNINNDHVGEFLINCLKICENTENFANFVGLSQAILEKQLRINAMSNEYLHNLTLKCGDTEIQGKIIERIDSLMDFTLKPEVHHIPHPRDMGLDELECHLLELNEKNMETRGVLRRLIQMHANLGNFKRVSELRNTFLSSGFEETAGMKSSTMYSYILGGHLEEAQLMYEELREVNPEFKIDTFKIIDFATLFVENSRFNDAIVLLENHVKSRKIVPSKSMIRNCWKLLSSCKNDAEQTLLFDFLVSHGFCEPSNVLLGPLLRTHLSRGNLETLVERYKEISSQYNCTPLKLEIFCAIIKAKNENLLQEVVTATEKIHGTAQTHATLVAAFAENNEEKLLTKALINAKTSIKNHLHKQCLRWVQEKKINCLKTLANASGRLSEEVMDINNVYSCIMDVYCMKNDCENAISFFESVQEKLPLNNRIVEEKLKKLIRKCNYKPPVRSRNM